MNPRRVSRAGPRRRVDGGGPAARSAAVVLLAAVATICIVALLPDAEVATGVGPGVIGVAGLAASGEDSPIRGLTEKVRRLADGDHAVEFDTGRDDEVGELSDALADLTTAVQRRERELAETERYRQELHEVTADPDLDDEEKIQRLLELGCERLGVENGHVTLVDRERGRHEVIHASGSDLVEAGAVTDLGETYCRKTVESDDLLAARNAPEEGWEDDPAYEKWDIGCYVGGTIHVEGELYGTLCFVNREPLERTFGRSEKAFVDLLTQWTSQLLERRESEQRLREEKARFESLVDEVEEYAIFLLDEDGYVRSWNRGAERIKGYDAEEVVGEHFSAFYTDEAREAGVPERNLELAREDGSVEDEGWRVRADGTRFWASVTITALHDDDGEFAGYAKVTRDMTERRANEERLETERDRFSALFENTPNEIARVDIEDGDVIVAEVNDNFEEAFGYGEEEIVGESLVDITVPPGDRDVLDEFRDQIRSGEHIRHEVTRQTATGERQFIAQFVPIGESTPPEEGYAVYTDITERNERERQLDALVQNTESVIYIKDEDGRYEFVNEAGARYFGLEREAVVGKYDYELFDDETAADIREDDQYILRTGESISKEAVRPIDGQERVFLDNKYPYRDEDGDVVGLMGVSRDITERKEHERQLQEYREYTERTLDAIDDVFYMLDEDGDLQRWNRSLRETTGYSDEEIEGMHALDFFAEADREPIADAIEEVFETGDTRVEAPFLTKDGDRVPHEFVATRLADPDGNPVLTGIGRDVTERVETERELSRLISNVPGYVYRLGAGEGWPTEFVSDGIEEITGYSPETLESGEVSWIGDIQQNGPDWDEVHAAVEAGEPYSLTYPIETADGEERWIKDQGRAVYSHDGEVEAVEGVVIDVTERIEYERELEWARDLLRHAQRIGQIGGWELDVQSDPYELFFSEETCRIHGIPPDCDLSVEEAIEFYHPEDRADIREAVERAIEDGASYDIEARLMTVEGEQRWVRAIGEPVVEDGEVVTVRGSIQNITERVETERELSRLISNVPGYVYRVRNEPEWPTEFVSDGIEEITGYTPEQIESGEVTFGEDINVENNEALWEDVQTALDKREPFSLTYPIETADGERRWVKEQGRGVYGADGDVKALEGVVIDVTERKERERELERTGEILTQTQRIAGVGGWEIDVSGDPPYDGLWTDQMYDIYEIESGELPDFEAAHEYTHPADRERLRDLFAAAIEDGKGFTTEHRIVTGRGNERWVRVTAEPSEDGETVRGALLDVTDRKERERELQRTTDLLEQAQQMAGVGAWSVDVSGDPPHVLDPSDELYDLLDLPADEELTVDDVMDFFHPAHREEAHRVFDRALATGDGWDEQARVVTPSGEDRWIRTIGKAVVEDGEVVRILGSIQDITEQKERERTLRTLHETARGLLATETESEVGELAVETANSVLDVAGVCTYLLDEASNRLVSVASEGSWPGGTPPTVGVGAEDAVWQCFATGSPMVVDATDEERRTAVFADGVEAGLLVPIGDHGVFVVAANTSRIDDETRRLAGTLVATTEAALDRLESEAALRARDEELEARNERLRRQIQITDIIRRVDQSLVAADSREEVERTVCEVLVESDDVAFAWIGTPDASDERLVPQTWAGEDGTYLDELPLDGLASSAEPALATARTESPTVVSNVVDELQAEAWRKQALTAGFHSAVSVPLSVDEYSYGVLTVYADEPGTFGDLERTVFAELGRTIANAIDAVTTRAALHADTQAELTLAFDDADGFLPRLARGADCEVTYEGIATHSADATRLFFATTGAASDAVEAVLGDMYSVEEYRLIDEGDGRCLFEATVTGPVLAATLVGRGASPRSITATPDGTEAVVDVSTATDVREFVETLGETYAAAELVSRRTVERSMGTRQELVTSLLDDLTDRQREVLRTAYYAGFFHWPRKSTGEEVAEMLDVTQPTVNRHLRLGQQRLLSQLFEAEEAAELSAEGD